MKRTTTSWLLAGLTVLALPAGAIRADDPAGAVLPRPGEVFFREPDEGTRQRIKDLMAQSTSDAPRTRGRARADLVALGYWAVEPLIVAARDRDPAARCASILTLDAIGDARAVEPLREIVLREDSNPYIGAFAALALGRFRDVGVLRDPKDPFRESLDNPHSLDLLRAAIPFALARMRSESALGLKLLREQLADGGAVEPVTAARLLALGFFPDAAVVQSGDRPAPPLEAAMRSNRQGERQAALLAFLVANARTTKGKDYVAKVAETDTSPRVQAVALIGLAAFAGADVTERIAATMTGSGPDSVVRELACDLLVERADAAALPALLHVTRTQQTTRLRASAVLALGRLAGADAHRAVIGALSDKSPLVRSAASVAAARSSSADLRADALARIDARLQGGETDADAREVLRTARAVLAGERREVAWREVGTDPLFASVLQTPRQRLIRAVNRRVELSLDLGKITDVPTEQGVSPDDLSGGAVSIDAHEAQLEGIQGPGDTSPPPSTLPAPTGSIGTMGSSRTSAWPELRDLRDELRRRPYFTLDDLPAPPAAVTAPAVK